MCYWQRYAAFNIVASNFHTCNIQIKVKYERHTEENVLGTIIISFISKVYEHKIVEKICSSFTGGGGGGTTSL